MESIILLPKNKGKLLILGGVFMFLGLLGHMHNASKMIFRSVEILPIETIEWDLSIDDLPSLEIGLEGRLEQVRQGLPLTQAQMQELQKLYDKLIESGGTASIHERIIELIRDIVLSSGTAEVSLEHYQNGKTESDDIQGMDGQTGH